MSWMNVCIQLGCGGFKQRIKKEQCTGKGVNTPSHMHCSGPGRILTAPSRGDRRNPTRQNKCIAQQEVLRWSNWSRHKLDQQIWRKAQHCIVSGQSCLLTKQWGFVWVNSSCSWRGFWWSFKNVIQCEQKNLFALWMGWRTILSQKKLGWHHTTPHPPIQASWSIWPVEVCKCDSWHFFDQKRKSCLRVKMLNRCGWMIFSLE